ncbi:uncharacterized protein ACNLHF_028320 [Anomaloglossus baeobatrachus]
MEQLHRGVTALSPLGLPSRFTEYELYFLIFHIKEDEWIHLMRVLSINEAQMNACCSIYSNRLEQKYQMLQIWLNRRQDGLRTHRDELVEVLVVIGYEHLASMFRNGCSRSAPQLR